MPVSKKTVYLTADRTRVVPEGHADAAFLLARAGAQVSEADAKQYKIETDADPAAYDAIADHDAKHGGETDQEAVAKRDAMLRGEKAKAPEANKAKAPEANK